jgi:hypothetical protein
MDIGLQSIEIIKPELTVLFAQLFLMIKALAAARLCVKLLS